MGSFHRFVDNIKSLSILGLLNIGKSLNNIDNLVFFCGNTTQNSNTILKVKVPLNEPEEIYYWFTTVAV